MKKLLFIPLIMTFIAGLIVGGCTKPAPPTALAPTTPAPTATTPTPKYGGIQRVITDAGPPVLGWPPDMNVPGLDIAQLCLEGLLHGDNKGGVYPWLAESYKVADDLKSITFKLIKGVKFHDGSDFNAEVAKWNLDNTINSKGQSGWASVDIIDDYTIRVNFTQWSNTLVNSFADDNKSWMVSKAAFDKNGIDWMRQNPVGTGPFKFVSYQPSVGFKTVRNPDYWQKGKPYLDGVEYIFIADPTTREMVMQTGEADMVFARAGKEAADLAAIGLTLKIDVATAGIFVLIPDTANADSPWANQKVRQAVEYAIDREAIAKALGYGYWEAPYQIPPHANMAYNPDFTLGRKYDLDKAKQLLADAGYPDGFKTTIIACPFGLNRDVIVSVQAYLAKVGIQAELDYPDPGRFTTYSMGGGWHNGALYTLFSGFANYNKSLSFSLGGSFNIYQSWLKTPEFTQALNDTLASPTLDAKLVRAVTDILTKDASIIPINEIADVWALEPYVMADLGGRSTPIWWNPEQAWLNK